MSVFESIDVKGAREHNLKNIDVSIERGAITVVTGVSGSGKSSLAFDTILAESQRRFFYTLSHYSRQFLDLGTRPQVRSVTGLSPAISLAQNETAPSRRATLGSLTDLSELLAVMYARFGSQTCPKHQLPTSSMSLDDIVRHIAVAGKGHTVALVVPVAESKKGVFKAQMTKYVNLGYQKAWIDGKLTTLDPLPELEREEKHTIKVLIDLLKIKDSSSETPSDRLVRGVSAVMEHGDGFGEWISVSENNSFKQEDLRSFSTKGGCPQCGFSWPRLDSRYFNANSLGRCGDCDGYGVPDAQEYAETHEDHDPNDSWADQACEACDGTGVQADAKAIKLGRWSVQELLCMPLDELVKHLSLIRQDKLLCGNPAFCRVYDEVSVGLDRLVQMKLGYLSLARRVRSLSGGESQRVKLAGILSENLRGILYVLDEPSQGLHHSELQTVIDSLRKLRDEGNTIIVVDHDETMMRAADRILDLGPGGGVHGGYLVGQFAPSDALKHVGSSRTASWLMRGREIVKRSQKRRDSSGFLELLGSRLHNLQIQSVKFPLEALSVVTGVSGSGKSSLVLGVLFQNLIDAMNQDKSVDNPSSSKAKKVAPTRRWSFVDSFTGWEQVSSVYLIDRRPIAKSSVSMPATYLDITSELRDLYASLPDAQVAGLTAKAFSLHLEGGRCPECKGRGEINLQMRFLADARIQCPVCRGARFRSHVLDLKFNGLNMSEVLSMSIDEAANHFTHHRRIVSKLAPAQRLGLGYLKLGQPSASLSGGESQRLKMVPFFTKKMGQGSVLILDEPTTGLHFEDVERLIAMMRELVDLGATLIVIEHNDEVRRAADWEVMMGPASAAHGGRVVYQGIPK
jgi:excinuclease ABC subunit A